MSLKPVSCDPVTKLCCEKSSADDNVHVELICPIKALCGRSPAQSRLHPKEVEVMMMICTDFLQMLHACWRKRSVSSPALLGAQILMAVWRACVLSLLGPYIWAVKDPGRVLYRPAWACGRTIYQSCPWGFCHSRAGLKWYLVWSHITDTRPVFLCTVNSQELVHVGEQILPMCWTYCVEFRWKYHWITRTTPSGAPPTLIAESVLAASKYTHSWQYVYEHKNIRGYCSQPSYVSESQQDWMWHQGERSNFGGNRDNFSKEK